MRENNHPQNFPSHTCRFETGSTYKSVPFILILLLNIHSSWIQLRLQLRPTRRQVRLYFTLMAPQIHFPFQRHLQKPRQPQQIRTNSQFLLLAEPNITVKELRGSGCLHLLELRERVVIYTSRLACASIVKVLEESHGGKSAGTAHTWRLEPRSISWVSEGLLLGQGGRGPKVNTGAEEASDWGYPIQ